MRSFTRPTTIATLLAACPPALAQCDPDTLFGAPTPYVVTQAPEWVETADFDGDGHLDLVTCNVGPDAVSVLLGVGDGTFGAAVDYPTGDGPKCVRVADMNGDTIPDIITSDELDTAASVLLGNGDGTFAAPISSTIAGFGAIDWISIADFDQSGSPDLVAMSGGGGGVYILTNNGAGALTAQPWFFLGPGSITSVTAGDINGDSDPDFVATDSTRNVVYVCLGIAGLNFSIQEYPIGGVAQSSHLADLNGDGLNDILVGNLIPSTVGVLLNLGGGAFSAQVEYPVTAVPRMVTTADVDSDGDADILMGGSFTNDVTVLINNGDGTLQAERTFPVGAGPYTVAAGDFNEDGAPDIAGVNQIVMRVAVLLNTCPGAAGCNPADLAEPYGVIDFSDVIAFLTAFGAMDPAADIAAPFGVWDFSDVLAFLSAVGAGCP